jgi:hypothetical protein
MSSTNKQLLEQRSSREHVASKSPTFSRAAS